MWPFDNLQVSALGASGDGCLGSLFLSPFLWLKIVNSFSQRTQGVSSSIPVLYEKKPRPPRESMTLLKVAQRVGRG